MNKIQLMNVDQFAEALGVTKACIRRWILERRVATVKLGRLVRIPETEAERMITSGFRPARRHGNEIQG
jgi:excisionase family DNA binding protein